MQQSLFIKPTPHSKFHILINRGDITMENREWKLDSTFLRDQNMEMNGERMKAALRGFRNAQLFGLISGVALSYISILGFTYRLSSTLASAAISKLTEIIFNSEHNVMPYNTTGWLIVLPLSAIVFFLSFFANTFHIKPCGRILSVVYPLFMAIGIAAGFGVFDDMAWWLIFPFMLYGIAGFWLNDFTLRGYKELDYLVTQEGFPSFNLAIHYFRRSHYVKMREKWLKENKPAEYFSEMDRPVENVAEPVPELPGQMGSAAADKDETEEWFAKNKAMSEEALKANLEENAMDGLATEELKLPDSDDYYREQECPKGIKRH